MIRITKIFYFDMAHAIYGYDGRCKNIHGHTYELHVTVAGKDNQDDFIPPPGFVVDFKELKQQVKTSIVNKLDHSLVLSESYIAAHPESSANENLHIWKMEPTAENILLYIQQELKAVFSAELNLVKLKLYETRDSYAEWSKH